MIPETDRSAVLRLAVPAIAQQLLHTAVFLVDRGILGHYQPESLASMQMSGPIVWSTYSILSAFTVGSIAVIGRSVGAKETAAAGAATRASMLLALVMGLLATAFGLTLLPWLQTIFPEAGTVALSESQAYLRVAFVAMPLTLTTISAGVCLSAAGDTRTPFVIGLLGNALNLTLSYALVFGKWGLPSLGAQGAALGTAASFLFESLSLTIALWRNKKLGAAEGFSERLRDEITAAKRMWKVASASTWERALQHAGFFGYVILITSLGATSMAANQAVLSIEGLVFMSADGFGIASAALVAQRLGARDPDGARRVASLTLQLTVAFLFLVGVIYAVFPGQLLRAFTPEAEIVSLGIPCLWIAAACAPFLGLGVVYAETLRGAGSTREALWITFLGGVVVRLSVTAFCIHVLHVGLVGVWLGSTVDWVVRAILGHAAFRRGRWLHASV